MTSPIDAHDTDAKLSLQQRQQLSALVDGDLAPDQAAFLLRRLGHDAELAGRWQRWQVIGDVLRRQPVAALPAGGDGFPARVAAAVAGQAPRAATARRPRWPQVAALAASVAVVALLVARPPSGGDAAVPAPGLATTVEAPAAAPVAAVAPPASPTDQPPPAEPVREVSVPQFAEAAPAPAPDPGRQVAVASPRGDAAPPATQVVADTPPDVVLAAAAASAPGTLASGDIASGTRPFARPDEPQARPWPRATLPGLARPAGEFTVGFDDGGQRAASAPSFYPFEPQLSPVRALPGAGSETADPERIRPERNP